MAGIVVVVVENSDTKRKTGDKNVVRNGRGNIARSMVMVENEATGKNTALMAIGRVAMAARGALITVAVPKVITLTMGCRVTTGVQVPTWLLWAATIANTVKEAAQVAAMDRDPGRVLDNLLVVLAMAVVATRAEAPAQATARHRDPTPVLDQIPALDLMQIEEITTIVHSTQNIQGGQKFWVETILSIKKFKATKES